MSSRVLYGDPSICITHLVKAYISKTVMNCSLDRFCADASLFAGIACATGYVERCFPIYSSPNISSLIRSFTMMRRKICRRRQRVAVTPRKKQPRLRNGSRLWATLNDLPRPGSWHPTLYGIGLPAYNRASFFQQPMTESTARSTLKRRLRWRVKVASTIWPCTWETVRLCVGQ